MRVPFRVHPIAIGKKHTNSNCLAAKTVHPACLIRVYVVVVAIHNIPHTPLRPAAVHLSP